MVATSKGNTPEKYILLFLTLIAGISFFLFFPKASPTAKLNLQVNRNESLKIAKDYIRSQGYRIDGYSRYSVLYIKNMEESFLQSNHVSKDEREAFEKFCPVSAWEVIYRSKDRNERFRLLISPNGEVFHFQHVLPSDIAGADLPQDSALVKFKDFLTSLWNINWDDYELVDAQSVTRESRTDHYFKLERKKEGVGGIKYRIWGVVAGDQVDGWDRHFEVPPDFAELFNRKSESTSFFDFGRLIIILGIFMIGLISFVMRFHAGEISTRNSFIFASFAFVVSVLYFADYFTSQPVLHSAFTEDNRILYITAVYINLGVSIFFITLALFFVWGSGESMTREYWANKLKVVDGIFAKKAFFPEVGQSTLRGFSLALVQLGLWYGVLYLISGNPKIWILVSSEDQQAISTFLPVGVPIISALFFMTVSTAFAPLFAISFLRRSLKNTTFAVILAILIFETFYNVLISIHSRWIQVGLSVLIGSIYYLYYMRYDLFTVAAGTFITFCLYNSMIFFVQPDSGFQLAGIVGFGTLTTILIFGLFAAKRGRLLDEEEIRPRYSRVITERERLKMELEIARKAQLGMLPREIPKYPLLDIAAFMEPAKEVGGDYYDFIQIAPDKLGIVVGDVSGKGMPAALYMTLMKGFVQSHRVGRISPGKVLARINRSFYQTAERNVFVSVFYCIIDLIRKEMIYARAGHNPTIMIHNANNQTSLLQPAGMAIGLDKGEVFDRSLKEETLKFDVGDIFIFYTDGLTEGRNKASEEFGEGRLMEIVNEHKDSSSHEILDKIRKAYSKFVGKKDPDDDLTCLVVKII